MSDHPLMRRILALERRLRARVLPVLGNVAPPPGGYALLYVDKLTGKLTVQRADGTVTKLGAGGGGGAPSGAASGDLGGTYPSPTVTQARGLRETSGPTTLTLGAVADGQALVRSGSTIVGAYIALWALVSGTNALAVTATHSTFAGSTWV